VIGSFAARLMPPEGKATLLAPASGFMTFNVS
jgi:hypothetical protein